MPGVEGRAASVDEAFGEILDTGLVTVTDEGVRLTEAGDVFVSWWLQDRLGEQR